MSTRQQRLSSLPQIQNKIDQLIGKKINVVLSNGTVVFGRVLKASAEAIIMENARLKKISYPCSQISELYVDLID
jgi:hypothetical protein